MASRKQFGSFSIDPDYVAKMTKNLVGYNAAVEKEIKSRMGLAVNIIWTIAHQRRPQISAAQAKSEGRGYKTVINSKGKMTKKIRRVSNPDAQAGVPVDTGVLQAHVLKEVVSGKAGVVQGRIYVEDVEYALAMEFGSPTKNVRARPYMRPAVELGRAGVKAVFQKKAKITI